MQDAARSQCIEIAANRLLIALADGRCWLTEVGSADVTTLPVSAVAVERASLAASAVEGAICAGLAENALAAMSRSFTLHRYIRWLAGNYVFAGQTPGLLRRAAERFEASARRDLAAFARKKAEEEEGHADLAYRDLEALGLPAAETIRLVQPPSANVFADSLRAYVESSAPIALFGFSYCLERMAVGRDDDFIREIEAICPPHVRACRFLKVHSNIGSDGAHVDEQLSLFESFTGPELAAVVRAAYETAQLLARQPSIDQAMPPEEVERRLRRDGMVISGLQGTDRPEVAI